MPIEDGDGDNLADDVIGGGATKLRPKPREKLSDGQPRIGIGGKTCVVDGNSRIGIGGDTCVVDSSKGSPLTLKLLRAFEKNKSSKPK